MHFISQVNQYFKLLKAGLANSILITVIPGFLVGSTLPTFGLIFLTLFGTWLCACSAFVFNQVLEIKKDALMQRTQNRPLVTQKLSINKAIIFGSTLLGCGLIILSVGVNSLTALLSLFSFSYYIFIYTTLKKKTFWNTVIGSVSGSIGPLIGEAAVSGKISEYGVVMFVILFFWQPAHFWCLSIKYKNDYAKADFKMLSVIKGEYYTIKQAILYQVLTCIFMVVVSIPPINLFGIIFIIPSIFFGVLVIIGMLNLKKNISENKLNTANVFFTPLKVFFMTILFMLFWHVFMTLDLYIRLWNN